jgi:hypothetical protein
VEAVNEWAAVSGFLNGSGRGVLTTLIGVFGGSIVSRRAQDRHWIREHHSSGRDPRVLSLAL